MPMDARRFDKRITIESRTETRTSSGAITISWGRYLDTWAQSLYQGSREFVAASQVHSEVSAVFIIRSGAAVDNRMRVNYQGQLFDIVAVDILSDVYWTRLICRDGQRQGS
jgi:SPP1 family predicted phage head-tail adaptor